MNSCNMAHLIACFQLAKASRSRYVAVRIAMEGYPEEEVIINKYANFDKKLEYYKNAYNDDLTLKANNNIRITGFIYAETYDEIRKEFYYDNI